MAASPFWGEPLPKQVVKPPEVSPTLLLLLSISGHPLTQSSSADARAGNIEAAAGGAAGATTGNNASDNLTRTHRMTLDEARMILNMEAKEVKENGEAAQEKLEKVSGALQASLRVAWREGGRAR